MATSDPFLRHTLVDRLSFIAAAALNRAADAPLSALAVPEGPEERLFNDCTVVDYRGKPRLAHYDPKEWGFFVQENKKMGTHKRNTAQRGRARGMRAWEGITAVMLHTTATPGMAPQRFLGVPVQLGCAHEGEAVFLHPLEAYLWHGDKANRFSIGIEISGDRDIRQIQIPTARALVRFANDEALRNGGGRDGRMAIMGHRQSSRKSKDPDAEIWREVGEWGMDKLGMVMGPVLKPGQPIPPRGVAW